MYGHGKDVTICMLCYLKLSCAITVGLHDDPRQKQDNVKRKHMSASTASRCVFARRFSCRTYLRARAL